MIKYFICFTIFCAALCAVFADENAKEENLVPPSIFYSKDAPLEELDAVLSEKDFGEIKTNWRIRLKDEGKEEEETKTFNALWAHIFNFFASMLRVVVIALVVAAIVFIIIAYRKQDFPKRLERKKGVTIASKDKKDCVEQLLEDAMILYKEGNRSAAWSICYRCSLLALSKMGIVFPCSATEYECKVLVSGAFPSVSQSFEQLVKNRIDVAYRFIEASNEEFDMTMAFCRYLLKNNRNINEK
jgi:hypothetical protein